LEENFGKKDILKRIFKAKLGETFLSKSKTEKRQERKDRKKLIANYLVT
jgi:hypothetical protein